MSIFIHLRLHFKVCNIHISSRSCSSFSGRSLEMQLVLLRRNKLKLLYRWSYSVTSDFKKKKPTDTGDSSCKRWINTSTLTGFGFLSVYVESRNIHYTGRVPVQAVTIETRTICPVRIENNSIEVFFFFFGNKSTCL